MKLNSIALESYNASDNKVTFVLNNTTLSSVLDLDGEDLTVTDEDVQITIFSGYEIVGLDALENGQVAMRAMRKLDDRTSEAIAGLDANVQLLSAKVDDFNNASKAVNTVAKMLVSENSEIKNSDISKIIELIPDWQPDISYKRGQIVKYDNKVYRLAQDTTSTDIYKPGTGTESLYTLIDLAEDGVRVWHMPTDATNSFALGELARYPTASDPIYRSKRNGNTSEPTTDAWWELVE